jgi:hemolysin activation/secretion protein
MSRHHSISAIWIAMVFAGCSAIATAQQPDRGTTPHATEEPKRELSLSGISLSDRTPVLPDSDLSAEGGMALVEKMHLSHVRFESGTILEGDEGLSKIIAQYEGNDLSTMELFELRRKISALYVDRGYINSGVIIPDQKVTDGVVMFREIRGKLTKIDISGNGRLSAGYINKRIGKAAGEPLQVQNLQKAMEMLQQDPLIRQVNARLVPGLAPGEAELKVAVKRNRAFQAAIGADNQGSASTGGERGTLALAYMNLTGLGDTLSADLGVSGGYWLGSAAYSIPINSKNTRVQASFSIDHARIIEEPFREIDIRSKTMRGGLYVAHPWLQTPSQSLVSTVGIEAKHSESTLLGIPFSFSPGDRNGKSSTTPIGFGIEYTARMRDRVLATRGNLRFGVDLFNPTINDQGTDGRFTAFVGQFQYGQRIGLLASEFFGRGTLQISADPLLALEKMPIGGLNTVRGYRENQFVRDNGIAASVEWRIPIHPKGSNEDRFNPLNLRVAPFIDYGRSWDVEDRLLTSKPADVYSAGIGLLWNPLPDVRVDFYWGYAFKNVSGGNNDLQDKGLHFTTSYKLPF